MLNRNYPIIIGLIFFVAVGYWAYIKSLGTGAIQKTQPSQQNADFFLEQANILKYNAEGQLDYQLSSDSISHYPHNDTTLLSQPHMTSYRKPGQITDSEAVNGKLLSGNETLILWDSVVMTQNTLATAEKVRMDTEYLTLYSAKGIAETDKPVLITSNNSTTRAIGMKTFYEKGLINLKSRVRGFHEPD